MKKIMQTKFGKGGNCQSATIATLLGLSIEEVPCFNDGIDFENLTEGQAGAIYQDKVRAFLQVRGWTSSHLLTLSFFLTT